VNRVLALATVLVAVLLWPAAAAAQPVDTWPASAPAGPTVFVPPPMMFVVDVSGSMGDPDGNGTVKLEAAQQSLLTAINATATARQPVGLWSYPDDGDCGAGRLERAATSGGKDELDAIIRSLRPNGGTPTAAALQSAVDTLKAAGNDSGTVILVSDGESNCDGDPCETAKSITQQGFQLQVQTVGFDISSAGRDELRCVADATGGRYFDVSEGDELGNTLGKLTSAQLDLTVDAPTSTAAGLTVGVTATVVNDSVNDAVDTTLAIQAITETDGAPSGFVAVSAPVRKLGNLAPADRASRSWSIGVPPGTRIDTLRLRVSATVNGNLPSIVDKQIRVRAGVAANDMGDLLADGARGTVAILGDSFSSGEGAGDYTRDTDVPTNRCHRSPRTYGADFFPHRKIIACSGAVVENLYAPQWNGDDEGRKAITTPPQLAQLGSVAGQTTMVLMSMGGNDIRFADIVAGCALPLDCQPFTQQLSRDMTSLAHRLPYAYEAVDAVVNGPSALAARRGKVAPIVILAYPSLVSLQDVGDCPHLTRHEADRGDRLVQQLDSVLAGAVRSARAQGVPAYLATDLQDAFRPDHTLCAPEDKRYVNSIRVLAARDPVQKQQMMHPNANGYQALTGALVRWSNREQPKVGHRPSTRAVRTEEAGEPVDATDTAVRGETVRVSADGFAPDSGVVLALHSTPRALATGYADDDGRVSLVAVLPSNAQTGHHDLVVSGVDTSGQLRTVAQPTDLRAAMPWWVHGFLGTAGLGVAATGIGFLRSRSGAGQRR
jgi:hypothetical protein